MIEPNEIIYLDNAATTRVDPQVLEAMLPSLRSAYGNASSGYRFGATSRAAIDLARQQMANLLGCEPAEIVFTSGGTESNHTGILSALQHDPCGKHIVTTAVEHSAVLRLCQQLEKRGCAVTLVPVDGEGGLDLEELEEAIRPETTLLSAMWANNETGVLFPVAEIAGIARRKRVPFHSDAVQAVGKVPVRLADLPINFCSVSAHKLHGPKGIGALYVNRRSGFTPLFFGGGQESGRRAGTENVAGIVALGKAAELAQTGLTSNEVRMREMRDRFENALAAEPDTFVNGQGSPRLPNISSLSFAGIESDAALMLMDHHGLCCSAGSACRTGSLQPSHVLDAMRLSEERLRGSLRFSFSRETTLEETDRAIVIVRDAIAKLRRMNAPVVGAEA